MGKLLTTDARIAGDKGQQTGRILFDTGASHSFVRRALAEQVAQIQRLPSPFRFTLGDGRPLVIDEIAALTIDIGGTPVLDTFMVFPGDGLEDVVLGASTMRKFGLKLDLEHSTVYAEMREQGVDGRSHEEVRMQEVLKRIFARLGKEVSDELTDDDAISMIVEMCQASPPPPLYKMSQEVLSLLDLDERADETAVRGKIMALKHRADVVPAEQFYALQAQLRERDVRDTVEHGIRDGKLMPAERDWALAEASKDLDVFKAFLANRPKVTPVGNTLPPAPNKQPVIDDVQRHMNEQLGLSQEVFAKYVS